MQDNGISLGTWLNQLLTEIDADLLTTFAE